MAGLALVLPAMRYSQWGHHATLATLRLVREDAQLLSQHLPPRADPRALAGLNDRGQFWMPPEPYQDRPQDQARRALLHQAQNDGPCIATRSTLKALGSTGITSDQVSLKDAGPYWKAHSPYGDFLTQPVQPAQIWDALLLLSLPEAVPMVLRRMADEDPRSLLALVGRTLTPIGPDGPAAHHTITPLPELTRELAAPMLASADPDTRRRVILALDFASLPLAERRGTPATLPRRF